MAQQLNLQAFVLALHYFGLLQPESTKPSKPRMQKDDI